MRVLSLLVFLLVVWPSSPRADFVTGERLMEMCANGSGRLYCYGYLAGLIDGLEASRAEGLPVASV